MILIKILTENGEREWPIFDSTMWQVSYDAGAVYLIDDHLDGKLVARDRDYGLIGVMKMTNAEFKNQILPLVFCTAPPSENMTMERAAAVRSACPSGHEPAGSSLATRPASREGLAPALGEEISDRQHHGHAQACLCGCGAAVSIARKTDARTGAVKGEYQRFVRGHAARLHPKLEFADITSAWFDAHVTIGIVRGCWITDTIQVTVEGQRVYMAHVALLLRAGLPVTAEAISRLRVRGRCRKRKCVRPDHQLTFDGERAEDLWRRAAAIEHGRARLAAFKAERVRLGADGGSTG